VSGGSFEERFAGLKRPVEWVGRSFMGFVEEVGRIITLLAESFLWLIRPPYRFKLFFDAFEFVGIGSLFIILLVGTFTGAVFALQSYDGFRRFHQEGLVGAVVALSLIREMSPVMGALMVTARAGSAMATELGTMRVTEQIDAMFTLSINPVQYLVAPRILASFVMMPFLCMIFSAAGMLGAWVVGVKLFNIDPGLFYANIRNLVEPTDIFTGLVKATVFGGVFSAISCFKGYFASGGAKGVGVAGTQAVVFSFVSILVVDYFLTSLIQV
jgi:phospholipid/cholesterol/gamma-HCH transport system permease protein